MQIELSSFQDEVRRLQQHPGLPDTKARYERFAIIDPYPEIAPALLHAGHLASYAVTTGMIRPFEVEDLGKPATYLVRLEGAVRFLDAKGKLNRFYLSRNEIRGELEVRDRFILEPNGLCYVTLRPRFQIPAYLAARFNLQIRDVYRGLLVGTGPLVDPGFVGQLSIPVHNFTNNPYEFRADEGFVYFEFTKLSWQNPLDAEPNPPWVPPPIEHQPPFPSSKNQRRGLDDYIAAATGRGPAQSSIAQEIRNVTRTARRAKRRISQVTAGAVFGAVLLFLAVCGAIFGAYQLSAQLLGQPNDLRAAVSVLEKQMQQLQREVQGQTKGN